MTSTLFRNGVLWVGSPPAPRAGWLLVDGSTIAAVGDVDAPEPSAADIIDLDGGHLLPGLVDVHTHLSVGAWRAVALDGSSWRTRKEALEAVRRRATSAPGDGWVLALGVDLLAWETRPPTADDLEEAGHGRPVLLADVSVHRGLLSSSGYRAAALLRDRFTSEDVPRRRTGEPTGMVWEIAFGYALRCAIDDLVRGGVDHAALLRSAADEHLRLGLVHAHEPGVDLATADALGRLDRTHPLGVSWSHALLDGAIAGPDPHEIPLTPGGPGPDPSVKLFLDGGDRCAVALPYASAARAGLRWALECIRTRDPGRFRDLLTSGFHTHDGTIVLDYKRVDDAVLRRVLAEQAEVGRRLRIHALANDAVRQGAAILQDVGHPAAVVEHAILVDRPSVEALSASRATASIQPGFLSRYASQIVGTGLHRSLDVIPGRMLVDHDIAIAISSDHPCGPLDPLHNLRRAVDRGGFQPEHELTEPVAVDAMTRQAWAALGVDHPGALVEGGPADLTEVDGNPFAPPSQVRRTWTAGRLAAGPSD